MNMSGRWQQGRSPRSTATMFAGFLLTILLTGGNSSSFDRHLPADLNAFNQSSEETSGGNASSSEMPETHGNPQTSNLTTSETPGVNLMDVPPYLREYYKSFDDMPAPGEKVCTYQDILEYLNLSSSNDLFTMSRPVKNHRTLTYVHLEMVIAAILDVRETDQTLISYVWIYMAWDNKHIRWDPAQFCGLAHAIIPIEAVWKPDITIEEMVEKDKSSPSPYLKINHDGEVEFKNDQVVSSSCKIRVYQFPFDIQKCNISFKSLMHSDAELSFVVNMNTTVVTRWSRKVMETQYEWLFMKMKVSKEIDNFSLGYNQTSTVYTVYMRRRSVLYIANFLLPVLFLLCLDLASFLISATSGEKLSFKVTVMLAVTLMQLILKDILPCSSDRIPLIAVFCIGIFSLMMLSLLETILMMYLMEKDSLSQDYEALEGRKPKEQGKDSFYKCCRGKKRYSNCTSTNDVWTDQTPSVAKEGSSSQLTLALEKVSEELEQIERTVSALSCRNDEQKLGCWGRAAININRVFMSFYIVAVTLFLIVIFTLWNSTDDEP